MDKALWKAVQELLDAAEYALGPLDNYSDYDTDPYSMNYGPNEALSAHKLLKEAIADVDRLMPPNPETPMETAIARAEYEEDR